MRGRPIKSQIRQNIIEILYYMKKGYGYDIYKVYITIFPKVTMRSIYYHLNKGKMLDEFDMEIIKEKGQYSWGENAEKKYYKLGKKADVKGNKRVKEWFEKNKKNS